MRPLLATFAGCALSLSSIHAEDKAKGLPVPFPGLTTFVIAGGDSAMPEQISYDPALSKLITKPVGKKEEGAPEVTRVLSTRLNREADDRYFVDFDPGPSADPSFTISDEKTGKRIGQIGANALVLPGNGFIYAIGRSNNMHEERQKFLLREGELVEVKQPYSYIGLDSKANVPITLTSGQGKGEVVANIPKGDSLQVVLRDEEYLLIKTQFGLVGWWKMNTDVTADSADIEGIYYAGD